MEYTDWVITEIVNSEGVSESVLCKGYIITKNGTKMDVIYKIHAIINNDNIKDIIDYNIKAVEFEGLIYEELNKYKDLRSFFFNFIDYIGIQQDQIIKHLILSLTKRIEFFRKLYKIRASGNIGIIITEYVDCPNLEYFLINEFTDRKYKDNEDILKIKVSEILYSVLLGITHLYNIDFMHNDMHFKNILCNFNKCTEYYNNYNSKFISNSKIYIFDFDRSSYKNYTNLLLDYEDCHKWGSCNKKNYKDYYVFLMSLLRLKTEYPNQRNSKFIKFIEEIFDNLVPAKYRDNLKKKNKVWWSAYCGKLLYEGTIEFNQPCNYPETSDIYMPWLKDIYNNFTKYMVKLNILKKQSTNGITKIYFDDKFA